MDVSEAIETRLECRDYTDEPVDDETTRRILNAGRLAPSGKNVQHWAFILVDAPEALDRLASISTTGQWVSNADFAICILTDPEYSYHEIDAGRAVTNMQFEAWNRGIGSCIYKNIKFLEDYHIREYNWGRITGAANHVLNVWLSAAFRPKTWGIFPSEQFESGNFENGRPVPMSEERYRAFTIEAPPIGKPEGELQEYHPASAALFWFSNPPKDEFQKRIKTGMWLANWFLPTVPINNKRGQYFIDGSHWLWPRNTPARKSFTSGGARYDTLATTDGIRANPDNPDNESNQ